MRKVFGRRRIAGTARPKKPRVVIAAMAVGAIALTSTASAHFQGHSDADDVNGRLDIRNSSITRDGGQLLVKIATHDRFGERALRNGGFLVDFDSRGNGATDFSLRMDLYEGYYPYCTLYDSDGFSRQGSMPTVKGRSFACPITRSELEPTRHIRWRASSDGGFDTDVAPEQGWYRH